MEVVMFELSPKSLHSRWKGWNKQSDEDGRKCRMCLRIDWGLRIFSELEWESLGRQVIISSGREAPKGLAKELGGT